MLFAVFVAYNCPFECSKFSSGFAYQGLKHQRNRKSGPDYTNS
ncbi:hypothetical protein TIFTF001_038780 [Ficus carica]|uniref:Uncharacterized protein n=1 Tax=Ficus carica TaxID=3494 RepID=A0AA88JDA0_FICCA|nr:hypothetical protein TIFTF001_038780 [Ficus carica]